MKLFVTFWIVFAFSNLSFTYQDTGKKVITTNQYSITIPNSMSETDQLNPNASLQYQNLHNELYLTVFQEKKVLADHILKSYYKEHFDTNAILAYSQYHIDYYRQARIGFQVIDLQQKRINGLPAVIVTAEYRDENVEVIYLISYLEGKSHYYRIESFTLKDFESLHNDDMFEIINSFKEL